MFGYMVQLYMKETYERRHPVCMYVYKFCGCVSVVLSSISIKITVNWPDRNNTWTFFKLKQKYLQLFKPLLNQTHHFNLSYHCLGRKLCSIMAHIVSTWLLEVSTNNASAASLTFLVWFLVLAVIFETQYDTSVAALFCLLYLKIFHCWIAIQIIGFLGDLVFLLSQ